MNTELLCLSCKLVAEQEKDGVCENLKFISNENAFLCLEVGSIINQVKAAVLGCQVLCSFLSEERGH